MSSAPLSAVERVRLMRRGLWLEYATLGWNVVGVVVLAVTAVAARSVALAGFGLDSLIEIGASAVVIWELSDADEARRHMALRLIGAAFCLLAVYLARAAAPQAGPRWTPGGSLSGLTPSGPHPPGCGSFVVGVTRLVVGCRIVRWRVG